MKEQLISKDTAVLAQSKFFLEECDNHYVFHKTKRFLLWNYEKIDWNRPIFNAPTQSVLQKWLREKHNLHITITISYTLKEYYWEICNTNPQNFLARQEKVCLYSYEECLEAALQEALKLL